MSVASVLLPLGVLAYALLMLYFHANPTILPKIVPRRFIVARDTSGPAINNRIRALVNLAGALVPQSKLDKWAQVQAHIHLADQILDGVATDKIACVVQRPNFERVHTKIILPDSGAFAPRQRTGSTLGDAVIEQQRLLYITNTLAETLRDIRRAVRSTTSEIELEMDRTGHPGLVRARKTLAKLNTEVADYEPQLVIACARQRDRLMHTHPSLSHYEFHTENVHAFDHVPRYAFGQSQKPVERHVGDTSHISGIEDESVLAKADVNTS